MILNNKHIISFAVSLVFLLFSASCQKAPINGDLDGQWQVMSVTPEPSKKPLDERLYYCFYLHVCQLTFYDGIFSSGNMEFDGETLYLEFPNVVDSGNETILRQYGIDENPITFSVELLNKKSLILRHGDTVVTMRKF